MSDEAMKARAARAALAHVDSGMRLGIGTGSTAECFVRALSEAIGDGLSITGVPTSERTAGLCVQLGVPLASLGEVPELDLTVDGADEIDPDLNLIKGGGGALLREKIVAAASARMIVIADDSKRVAHLGRFPLPIEVNAFGLEATRRAVARVALAHGATGEPRLRIGRKGEPVVTDGGHHIIDASFGHISDPGALACALNRIPGVVEHGLFLSMADLAILAGPQGVEEIAAPKRDGEAAG
ncbi:MULTISPECIES: ribose-5-phosphate isomerase RpiA [unclassified Roseitalea]|uniref:ribose-5-phosphate isomerase RpiA n=1 Tax=unclassified Roseitalea TaxID=2639107 RepID=UPI00273FDC76|nr:MULTISPECIES: ribose-5-phosphate isomerase RpiA [unclassified Roseitalea]